MSCLLEWSTVSHEKFIWSLNLKLTYRPGAPLWTVIAWVTFISPHSIRSWVSRTGVTEESSVTQARRGSQSWLCTVPPSCTRDIIRLIDLDLIGPDWYQIWDSLRLFVSTFWLTDLKSPKIIPSGANLVKYDTESTQWK